MKYVFYTLLKANNCETRLKEIINPNIFVREGFVGWVRKGEFRIENRDKYMRNSFNRILYGQLAAIDHGTKIECKLKLPILILFMYIGMALLFGVYSIKAAALFINYVTGAFPSIVNGKKDIFNTLIALPVSIVIILLGKEISK
ncbi:hypothetical protein, partial [Clostridium sp. HMP27]|uniref:hypothetical protein n=1 Tax=Clostridium sp. HMP27 TaxID=1487921 RepID=UPI00052C0185